MQLLNACFDIAKNLGYKYFIQLDDDYYSLGYRYIEGNVVSCTVDINGKKSNLSTDEIICLYNKLVNIQLPKKETAKKKRTKNENS